MPRAAEERPDYQALADAAEAKAGIAATPALAQQWRDLAETYRKLAELLALRPEPD